MKTTELNLNDYVFLLDNNEVEEKIIENCDNSEFPDMEIIEGEDILELLDKDINEIEFDNFNDFINYLYENTNVINYEKKSLDKLLMLKKEINDEKLYNSIIGVLQILFTEDDIEILKYFDIERTGQYINKWNPTLGFDYNINDNIISITATSLVKYCAEDDVFDYYLKIDKSKKQYETNIEYANIEGYEKIDD